MESIPYEAQMNQGGQRTCGAAALSMVYKSFGLSIPQQSIWRVIALPDAYGGSFACTYRIPLDVILRGFCAVAFKARDPIRAVEYGLASGARVIMNHRLREDTGQGHYTVAVEVVDDEIEFHDPEFGPSQKRSVDAMRDLWQPKHSSCEITGNFLIAVSSVPAAHICEVCGVSVSKTVTCPGCNITIPIQPTEVLGCSSLACDCRHWESVVCPFCDAVFQLD